MPLTDTACKAFKPEAADYSRADGQGLSLLIKSTGAKWWRFSYRFNGDRKTISMGTFPDTSLKLAREKRDEARKMLAAGINPSLNRKAAKEANLGEVKNSFKEITLEWLGMKKHEWADSHYSKIKARMLKDVLPLLGNAPITAIKASDILQVLRLIESRGAIETAHRTRENISQIFRYAISTDRAERNPAPDLIGSLKKAKGKHMAAIIDPDKVGALLRQIETYEGTITVRCALQLAPLVFVRPGELRQAEWKDIDFDKAEWRFKASKTQQDHIVPLSSQALNILKQIFPFSGQGRYVFPSSRTDTRPMSNNAILSAFRRMEIVKEEMSGHGFRAMARTLLAEQLNYAVEIIEHQLAHQVRDAHGYAYNRTQFLGDRKKMMQDWANYLENLRDGGLETSDSGD